MDEITVPIYLITGFLESARPLSLALPSSRITSVQRERHFSFSAKRERKKYDEEALTKIML